VYAYPSLFEMVVDQDAWVSSQIQDNEWALTFRFPLSQPRLLILADLMNMLRQHTFQDTLDQVC